MGRGGKSCGLHDNQLQQALERGPASPVTGIPFKLNHSFLRVGPTEQTSVSASSTSGLSDT